MQSSTHEKTMLDLLKDHAWTYFAMKKPHLSHEKSLPRL